MWADGAGNLSLTVNTNQIRIENSCPKITQTYKEERPPLVVAQPHRVFTLVGSDKFSLTSASVKGGVATRICIWRYSTVLAIGQILHSQSETLSYEIPRPK